MQPYRLMSLCALLFLFAGSNAYADSPVWKVSKGDRHLFIGGTVHVLSQSDYPLPDAFERAYRQAPIIVFEADPRALQTSEFQQALLSRTTYPQGRDLTMVLDDETEADLRQYLAAREIPVDTIMRFKAGMVSITLTIIELQRLGLADTGVDAFFGLRALKDKKTIKGLENAEDQMAYIAGLGEGREDALIDYTLRQMADLPEMLQAMKTAWRTGDNARLAEVGMAPLEEDFPEVHDQFVTQRNAAWLPKIEAMLQTGPVELVLVGALHLVGEDGLLARLEKIGYTIENL